MSRFLAPIHDWLFGKIMVLENIEKEILNQSDESYKAYHKELVNKFGDFTPNQPLEEIIDKTNIHGWLQNRITIAESRQAAFVSNMLENETQLSLVKEIYNQAGALAAKGLENIHTPVDALNALNNVLLEGMPCDRVNQITEQKENYVQWITTNCVHKNNWENNGTPVVHYYRFREAFTKGFVEGLNKDYIYSYENADKQQHEIKVK